MMLPSGCRNSWFTSGMRSGSSGLLIDHAVAKSLIAPQHDPAEVAVISIPGYQPEQPFVLGREPCGLLNQQNDLRQARVTGQGFKPLLAQFDQRRPFLRVHMRAQFALTGLSAEELYQMDVATAARVAPPREAPASLAGRLPHIRADRSSVATSDLSTTARDGPPSPRSHRPAPRASCRAAPASP